MLSGPRCRCCLCCICAVCRCFESEYPSLRAEVLACLRSVVRVAGRHCGVAPVGADVAVALLQLQSQDGDVAVAAGAAAVAADLARALELPDLTPMIAAFISDIVTSFTVEHEGWSKHTVQRHGFDALLRLAPGVRRRCLGVRACVVCDTMRHSGQCALWRC
jgi:hypothetical protein